jgi:lysophospholipase L1-like esterase
MKQLHIACLGDSLTHGYGVRQEESWVFLAGLALAPGVVLHNHGLNGDTTAGMLQRLHAAVLPAHPDAVVLMGGANDIVQEGDWETARANMPVMIRDAARAGVMPLIGIPLPFIPPSHEKRGDQADWAKAATEYDGYAYWLRAFCTSSGCRIVDFRAFFEAETARDSAGPDGYFFDGLHFNARGHQVLASCIIQHVKLVWKKRMS